MENRGEWSRVRVKYQDFAYVIQVPVNLRSKGILELRRRFRSAGRFQARIRGLRETSGGWSSEDA